jgi:phage protein D/phage baseplate assembly protein gpV
MKSPILTVPQILVQLDGSPFATEDRESLEQVRIQQRLSLPALCELTFMNPKGALAEAASPVVGLSLNVALEGSPRPLFSGDVTAIEYHYQPSHELEVRIRAYDVLHRLRKQQPVRAHVEVKLADLARELAAEAGLTVESAGSGPLWRRLIQHRQSDLGLLTELAQRCGYYLTLREDVLHLITLEGIGEDVPLKLGETLLEARVEVNADSLCRSISTSAWDPWRVESHQARTTASRSGRDVKIRVSSSSFGDGERTLTNETAQDDTQAEALAQAELDARVARLVTISGVAEGDARLQPGARVEIEGLALDLAGTYVLTAVTHTVDRDKGFVSEIASVPPPLPQKPTAASATLGIVTRINDPENLGRVQVALPAYNNVETDWMNVLATGAGSKKGLVALPDVGDQVLVLFFGEDPAAGIVLGGLYGTHVPPDWGIEGGAVRGYTFLTPGGQKVWLDDTRKRLHLENSDGSYIELAPEKVRLHSETDLEVEAPGHSVVFRGSTVDFQKA